MSDECDKCGEHALECECTEDIVCPEHIQKWFECKLLHEHTSIFTGQKIWNETEKKWDHEIIYVCKQGCK